MKERAETSLDWLDAMYEQTSERPSGVQRVMDRVVPADHETVFSEIALSWLSPANDSMWAEDVTSRDVLGELGSLERIPYVLQPTEASWAAETDHRKAFILGLADGTRTLNGVVDASPLPIMDVLRTIADLVREGIVGLA